jgi:hypothetical protein
MVWGNAILDEVGGPTVIRSLVVGEWGLIVEMLP